MRLWRLSDVKSFIEGTKSVDIDQNLRSEFPRTDFDFIKFVKKSRLKTVHQDFAITQKEKLIGGLSFIDDSDPMVELSCLWISPPYRSKGLAKEAIQTLINHIIEIYPQRGIFGQVYEFNENEILMLEKLGFKRTGNKSVPYKGKTVNLLRYEYNRIIEYMCINSLNFLLI